MNWIKIDKENFNDTLLELDGYEVLAWNGRGLIIGSLYFNNSNQVVSCENDKEIRTNITHYCLITYPNE